MIKMVETTPADITRKAKKCQIEALKEAYEELKKCMKNNIISTSDPQ